MKGLLLAVLLQVDIATGTRYGELAVKNRASTDSLIGTVSQVALNNILLIIIDECQNICRNKNGVSLAASMTQLINSSGVSICMVGLPETELFFRQEMQLARRSVGLSYSALPCGDYFIRFCETLFSYQYVAHPSRLTPDIIELLYECTGGILAVAVSIIMEAQQIAILTGKEELSKETVLLAYRERLKNVQGFVRPGAGNRKQASVIACRNTMEMPEEMSDASADDLISESVNAARAGNVDAVEKLQACGILMEEMEA